MKKKFGFALALCCVGVSSPAFADNAELYVSDESLQARYVTGADLIGLRAGNLTFDAFINEEDDLLGAIGLDFVGMTPSLDDWTFSAGPKIYAATLDVDDDDFLGVAAGGSASYALPVNWPSWVTGQFYYAPKITTTGDADDLMDFILRLETQFVERVVGFVGYRMLEADLEDGGDYDLDDDFHLGVRLSF